MLVRGLRLLQRVLDRPRSCLLRSRVVEDTRFVNGHLGLVKDHPVPFSQNTQHKHEIFVTMHT